MIAQIAWLIRRTWKCWMPEGTPPPLLHGCRLFVAVSVPLWVAGATGTAEIRDGAMVSALIAPMLWCTAFVLDRVDGKLVTLLCELARHRVQDSRQHLQQAEPARSQSR